MPDRTQEELKLIYNDLLLIREVVNDLASKGRFRNIPFNGISGPNEKKTFFQGFVDKWEDLHRSRKIQTCEGQKIVADNIFSWMQTRDEPYNVLKNGGYALDSGRYKVGGRKLRNHVMSLNELITAIKQTINGQSSPRLIESINKQLNIQSKIVI